MSLAKAFDTRKFVVHLKTTATAAVVGDTGPPASLSVPNLVNSALGNESPIESHSDVRTVVLNRYKSTVSPKRSNHFGLNRVLFRSPKEVCRHVGYSKTVLFLDAYIYTLFVCFVLYSQLVSVGHFFLHLYVSKYRDTRCEIRCWHKNKKKQSVKNDTDTVSYWELMFIVIVIIFLFYNYEYSSTKLVTVRNLVLPSIPVPSHVLN